MRFVPLLGAVFLGTLLGSQDIGITPLSVWYLLGTTAVAWVCLEFFSIYWARVLFWFVVVAASFLHADLAFQEIYWPTDPYQDVHLRAELVEDVDSFIRVIGTLPEMDTRIAVHLPPEEGIRSGDTVVFSGRISEPPAAPNPGVFCYKTYLSTRGATGVCWPEEYTIRPAAAQPVLTRLRAYLAANIRAGLSDPGLVVALVLGDRSGLSDEQIARWRDLGIAHLLAISGTHLGLLALIAGTVLNRLPVSRFGRFCLLQLILVIYVLLAGARPSTLRALLAALAAGWASLRRRQLDSLESWALVGCCLLSAEPRLIQDLGFQLSFAAAGGIVLWGPVLRFSRFRRVWRWLCSSLAVSAIAQVSILPLLLHNFGSIALLGTLATLVMVPFVTLLLTGGIFVALGAGGFGIGSFVDTVRHIMEIAELGLYKWAVVWRPLRVGVDLWIFWALFIYAGWRLRQPHIARPRVTMSRLAWGALFLAVLLLLPPNWKYPLEVTAVNVGQGDCIFVLTPFNEVILLDGGGDSLYWQERGRNVGIERVVPYLKYRGVKRLDAVILSHPDEDHLFGLLAVLENFPVRAVLDNGLSTSSQTYKKYLSLIQEKQIPRYQVRAGDVLHLKSGAKLRFLHPHPETVPFLSQNDASVVAALDYQGSTMLFTGDMEVVGILDLLERSSGKDLRADVVKVPHHGSQSSLVPSFYEAVDANWALICTGPNTFGHPHEQVLQYLGDKNITWRSTANGPVSFYSALGFVWAR
ncbi:MAG: DNA internalization-related competence protein ComEC/Rec2 [Limnochordia bacterium]